MESDSDREIDECSRQRKCLTIDEWRRKCGCMENVRESGHVLKRKKKKNDGRERDGKSTHERQREREGERERGKEGGREKERERQRERAITSNEQREREEFDSYFIAPSIDFYMRKCHRSFLPSNVFSCF